MVLGANQPFNSQPNANRATMVSPWTLSWNNNSMLEEINILLYSVRFLTGGFHGKLFCRLFFNASSWLSLTWQPCDTDMEQIVSSEHAFKFQLLKRNVNMPIGYHSNFAVTENNNPAFRAGRKNTQLSTGLSNTFNMYIQLTIDSYISHQSLLKCKRFGISVTRYH